MYYVYILKSLNSTHFYVGQTNNLEKRLESHNSGKVYWTKRYMPWQIHFIERYDNRLDAIRREKYFKSHAGRNWIKKKMGQ